MERDAKVAGALGALSRVSVGAELPAGHKSDLKKKELKIYSVYLGRPRPNVFLQNIYLRDRKLAVVVGVPS